jgi:hypothetical protein
LLLHLFQDGSGNDAACHDAGRRGGPAEVGCMTEKQRQEEKKSTSTVKKPTPVKAATAKPLPKPKTDGCC